MTWTRAEVWRDGRLLVAIWLGGHHAVCQRRTHGTLRTSCGIGRERGWHGLLLDVDIVRGRTLITVVRRELLCPPEVGQVVHLIADGTSESHPWHYCLIRCVMQVFGLLADSIVTGILQSTLDAALTGPLVACKHGGLAFGGVQSGLPALRRRCDKGD